MSESETVASPILNSPAGDRPDSLAAENAFKSDRDDGLDFVMDVPVDLTVEIGRRVMKIGDILRLKTGSVLELSKAAGEPLELYVNNHPIARGEPVVVGDRYGVRVTEVFVDDAVRRNGGSR
jgi:flagellar motor switch protein FliN